MRRSASALHEPAPAKLNLYLRVVGRRADGYHLLDSLVAFTELGDELIVEAADELTLDIEGPFAASLRGSVTTPSANLVIRAAQRLRDACGLREGASMRLIKNLPVASGIGGGSADAAATLRALRRLWRVPCSDEALAEVALALGADVPACLRSELALMQGIGQCLAPVATLPAAHVALVNPGQALETSAVFAARSGSFSEPAPPGLTGLLETAATAQELARLIEPLGNHLTEAAAGLVPAIPQVLAQLAAAPGCLLSRLSGSGATCFGLFDDPDLAKGAAAEIGDSQPTWWVAVTRLRHRGPSVAPARVAP